jgi:hypothetical protein
MTGAAIVNTLAQGGQASYTAFTQQVGQLSNDLQTGTVDNQYNDIRSLDNAMNKQITWLQTTISAKQAAYNKNKADMDDLGNKIKIESQANAVNDKNTVENIRKKMVKEEMVIKDLNNKLGTEQPIYNAISALQKADLQKADKRKKESIINDLNKFADTMKNASAGQLND